MKLNKILIAILAGLLLRLLLIHILPVVNDEGSYFYDAYLINQGFTPYKDFLTKSAPHIYMISFFLKMFGNTIFAGRIISLFLYAINVVLLYKIATYMFSKKSAAVVAMIFSLYPEVVALTSYAQTQNIQMTFGLLFMYVVLAFDFSFLQLFFLSLLLTAAFLSRVTGVIYLSILFVKLFYDVYEKKISITRSISFLAFFFISLFAINASIFNFVLHQIGYRKAFDVYGFEMLAQTKDVVVGSGSILMKKVASFVSNIGTLFYNIQLSPLFIIVLVFLLHRLPRIIFKNALAFIMMIMFFGLYIVTGRGYKYPMNTVAYFFEYASLFAMILLLYFIPDVYENKTSVKQKNYVYISMWLLSLSVLYGLWIKIRTPYMIEFYPAIVLACGYFAEYIKDKKYTIIEYVFFGVLVSSLVFSQIRSFTIFYTGTYQPYIVKEIAQIVRHNSSDEDTVLTASLVFPFTSERKIVENISHPYWLGYPDFDETLLKLYMKPLPILAQEIEKNPPRIIIYDKTTYETYFKLSKKMNMILKKNYKKIYHLEDNDGKYLIVYKLR